MPTTKTPAAEVVNTAAQAVADATTPSLGEQAKSKLDAAIAEAGHLGEQARATGEEWLGEAKTRAGDLAVEGKAKASEALTGLSAVIDENAALIDEKLGPKYGDYARTASRKIESVGNTLNEKSLEELGEDARETIRQNPVKTVAIATLFGFLVARMFRR